MLWRDKEYNANDTLCNVECNGMHYYSILKYIYKFDMAIQQQIVTNRNIEHAVASITFEMKRMEKQINDMRSES